MIIKINERFGSNFIFIRVAFLPKAEDKRRY